MRSNGLASTVFSIKIICGGEEQSTDLPLDQAMIGQLALEAEIRDMRIGELLAALIIAILKKNLLEPLLQRTPNGGRTVAAFLGVETTSMRTGMMGDQHNEYLFEEELLAAGCVRAKVIPAALVKGNFAPNSAISLKRLWPRETI